ncbi:hypothetical protein O181_021031 [Austropuccinia psidii MF-1]|uniref:Retrotransposon gag domain-containing protein n=1 Tax=Austropuccinia psidii MF-1 TaxID=1389203 RepID=A0A9Q3GVD1_9BASI|nr:hypothetical protein [Austropuccinia psidii MF-1]
MEGEATSRTGAAKSRRLRSFSDEEGEESEEIEVAAALVGAPEASEAANLAHSNQPFFSQDEPDFLKLMEQMTQFIGKLTQAVAPRDNTKAPAFNTPSMKEPDSFDGTPAHKLRGFIQSCQFLFHNYRANFFSDQKKFIYSTSFLTGRAGKWIEPYLSNISNEDPSYPLNNWQIFETQLFTLFCDPNEVRKAEKELGNLRMKESGHVSLYIADFRNQLAAHPGTFETLQELIYVTLELNTRYHERQNEKGGSPEKKPLVPSSNPSRPSQGSSSKGPFHKKNKKGKQFQSSKDRPHASLLNKDNKLMGSEKEKRIKEGLCTYCGGKNPIEKFFKTPQNKLG